MSKKSSEASAKRSVTATAARPAWRRAKTSPCSVAMWTCSTGSSPARSATSSSAAASSRQRFGLVAGGEHRAVGPRIAPPRRSGDISVR